ncbi:MAG: transcriptional initiation protein Tat [Haloplanus sp.]
MDRRGVLSLLFALAAGCSSNPPRATGARTPPTPGESRAPSGGAGRSMSVSDLSVEEADDGHLRVVATVTNPAATDRTRTLRIRVTVGETRAERSQEVTVPANDERDVAVDFPDVAYDDFSGNGSLQSSLV